MKQLIPVLIILMINSTAFSQTYDWVKNWGGSSFDIVNTMHVDDSGNSFLAGWIKDTVNISGSDYVSVGGQDLYISKINQNGQVDWVFTGGGINNDQGYGIDIDDAGNVYVAGSFQGPATFGSTTLNGFGTFDVFVIKLNSDGNMQWVKEFGSSLDDQANGLAVSPNGTIYIGGNCNNGFSFGAATLTTGGFDAFIAKLDNSGNPVWAKNGGSSSTDNLYGMDIDDNENIFITGYIGTSPANFGSINLTNNGDDDIYVTAYDSSGAELWAVSHGGTDQEQGQGVTVDNNGYVLATGYFSSTSIVIGSKTHTVSGINTMFLSKYDPASGNVMNSYSYPSDAGSSGQAISVDGNNNIYIGGSFRGSFISGNDTVVSAGNSDGLLFGLDDQMQPLCLTSINSTGFWDIVYGVGTDAQNNVYYSGTYNNGAVIDTYNLVSQGAADIFIAKLICDTSSATSIKEPDVHLNFRLFPNPFRMAFTIQLSASFSTPVTIRISDLSGRELLQKVVHNYTPDSSLDFSMKDFSNGIYIVDVESLSHRESRRVIKVED